MRPITFAGGRSPPAEGGSSPWGVVSGVTDSLAHGTQVRVGTHEKGICVAATTDPAAQRLGFRTDQVIQEWGYDDDVDHDLREGLEDLGVELVDEQYGDVTDSAIVWWRKSDGDLTDLEDLLVDVSSALDDGGLIWLLVPKAGAQGHVSPSDIGAAASTAGLSSTTSIAAAPGWLGVRLTAKGRGR